MSISTRFLDATHDYDGSQLAPHWIYHQAGLSGNALVAFQGKADVSIDHMVDLDDVSKRSFIYSPQMLHFLGEWFVDSLEMGILYQHFIVFHVYETLVQTVAPHRITRCGNDLFIDNRKLSVSIATRSTISTLIHMGVNVKTEGTPIPTAGLEELGLSAETVAQHVLQRFSEDFEIWSHARVKVRPR